jgi:hypothetical protein
MQHYEAIKKRLIRGVQHVKERAVSGATTMYDKVSNKVTVVGEKVSSVIQQGAKGTSKAIVMVQRAIEFENHMNNDIRFQNQCEKLAYMLYSDVMVKNEEIYSMNAVEENESYANLEKVLMNAMTIYTTLYFMDRSFYMSQPFMKFLIRYPITIQTEEDVINFIEMYEVYATKRSL